MLRNDNIKGSQKLITGNSPRTWERFFVRCVDCTRLLPFTARGLTALICSLAGLYFVARPTQDLVAYMLGGGIFGLVLLSFIALTLVRILLGQVLRIDIRFAGDTLLANRPIQATLILEGSSLPPMFCLYITPVFAHDGVQFSRHICRGAVDGQRALTDLMTFPHRGFWAVKKFRVEVGDGFGLTRFAWDLPSDTSIEISCPTTEIRPLPIIAASARPGDTLNYANERSGDLYDIRQYTPSDGISRVLWKVFAKSRELVVRRPEPAVLPEGQVALYLVARREDDHVASALKGYVRQLMNQQILVLFGTDGMVQYDDDDVHLASQANVSHCIADPTEINSTINRSVWSKQSGSGLDISLFLEALANEGRPAQQLVTFTSEDNTAWISDANVVASKEGTILTVVIVPKSLLTPQRPSNLPLTKKQKSRAMKSFSYSSSYLLVESAETTTPIGRWEERA